MMNNHFKFWLTFGSIITLLEMFIFMIMCGCINTFVFHKQYCVILIPNLLYIMFQFVVNYAELTDENKKNT